MDAAGAGDALEHRERMPRVFGILQARDSKFMIPEEDTAANGWG